MVLCKLSFSFCFFMLFKLFSVAGLLNVSHVLNMFIEIMLTPTFAYYLQICKIVGWEKLGPNS